MSEFKFACPVCGQHMMCDASQGGSVMDCPTCFQKIVAPQAPADPDSKFILAGSKLVEKKSITPSLDNSVRVEKTFPAGLVIALILLGLGASAAGYFVYSKKSGAGNAPVPAVNTAKDAPVKKAAAPLPPRASDLNWSLDLGTNAISDAPVAGRIHAQDFICERASFQNGSLMLRAGTHGAVEFAAFINFGGAQAESLSGQSLNVTADTERAAKISLRWKDASGAVQKENLDNGYAMRLEFGALANNRLPGKIWLCTPDKEKSYLLGSFNADARKPKPRQPKK